MMLKQIKYNRTVKNFMEMLYSLSHTRDMNETVYWYDDGDDIPLFYLSSENHLTIRTELFELTKKDFGLTSYEIAVIINKYIIVICNIFLIFITK